MTAHKHADNIARFARDAAETDKPWERWQASSDGQTWRNLYAMPSWEQNLYYRRKETTNE